MDSTLVALTGRASSDSTCSDQASVREETPTDAGVSLRYAKGGLLLVDLDVAPADDRAGVAVVIATDLVVIHHGIAVVLVPDVDPEHVPAVAVVDRGEHQPVVSRSVDSAGALVHSPIKPSDDQPVVAAGMEVQIARSELELRVHTGHDGALIVLRHEAEVGPTSQIRISHVSPRRGVDPPATGDEATRGVIDDHNGAFAWPKRRANSSPRLRHAKTFTASSD